MNGLQVFMETGTTTSLFFVSNITSLIFCPNFWGESVHVDTLSFIELMSLMQERNPFKATWAFRRSWTHHYLGLWSPTISPWQFRTPGLWKIYPWWQSSISWFDNWTGITISRYNNFSSIKQFNGSPLNFHVIHDCHAPFPTRDIPSKALTYVPVPFFREYPDSFHLYRYQLNTQNSISPVCKWNQGLALFTWSREHET
jgi:hypothetical protein